MCFCKKTFENQILNFYNQNYLGDSVLLVLKRLTYFEDANVQLQSIINKDFDWNLCKSKVIDEVLKL